MANHPNRNTDAQAQRAKAFAGMASYAVLDSGRLAATVAVKYGARLQAFVHWLGAPMVKGIASGGGYDKTSAAVASAAPKMTPDPYATPERDARHAEFIAALRSPDADSWASALQGAGFTVHQVL